MATMAGLGMELAEARSLKFPPGTCMVDRGPSTRASLRCSSNHTAGSWFGSEHPELEPAFTEDAGATDSTLTYSSTMLGPFSSFSNSLWMPVEQSIRSEIVSTKAYHCHKANANLRSKTTFSVSFLSVHCEPRLTESQGQRLSKTWAISSTLTRWLPHWCSRTGLTTIHFLIRLMNQ